MPGVGDDFHSSTKYERGKLPGHRLDWSTKPSVYKKYPESEKIDLPSPVEQGGLGLWEVIRARRSVRAYTQDPMSLKDLSQILWATQGITASIGDHRLRAAPSAGALYPIETYLVINNVENIAKGVYHYSIKSHLLEELKLGDFRRKITHAALEQRMCLEATVVFIWTAIFFRTKWKYNQRAYRYIYLDAGHIAQNLALSATSIGLGSCQIGALYDDELNQIINVDGTQESAIYMSIVGYPF